MPILVCGSFSDHSLHTRGSFEVFRRTGSAQKWLYTHRGGKWSTFYSADAISAQARFFAHFLKGEDNGWQDEPAVRIAVHEDGPEPVEVFHEPEWPPANLGWVDLMLDASTMSMHLPAEGVGPSQPAVASFYTPNDHLSFEWVIPQDMDIIGPMALRLPITIAGGGDASLFVGLRKFSSHGDEAKFEGSFGYAGDMVTKGWQRVAHRDLDDALSSDCMPVHAHERAQPLTDGEIFPVRVALLPQATRLRKGDRLRLDIRGSWHFPPDPLRGQFPANYEASVKAVCTVHTGGSAKAILRMGWRNFSDG